MIGPEDLSTIEQTPEGWWVIKGETHINGWVRQQKKLDHDGFLIPLACRHITPGTIAIDVGANIGTHTIAYLRAVAPGGAVAAYEPHPDAWECLMRNCPGAWIYRTALGEFEGTSNFEPLTDNVGMSHLDPKGSLTVPIRTLDKQFSGDVIRHKHRKVSFIKIDVEGAEPEVLRGAANLIKSDRPTILLEVNHYALERQRHQVTEIINFMSRNNYEMKIFPEENNWNSPQSELLCTPRN